MSKTKGLCVLLLEDDDADAYLTSRALLSLPRVTDVVRARDGQEAVAMLKTSRVVPDIAFIDLQMPTMDGMQFLTACMNENLAKVPLVVLTSSSDWKDALRSRVHGALLVITKPERPSDLVQALSDAIHTFVPESEEATSRSPRKAFDLPTAPLTNEARLMASPLTTAQSTPTFGRREPRFG